ncbi:MAG: hypothetical protein GX444_16330 [Myxococcales bacterium]|nr:hypothetical protein [Myxococcales bacterium]
MVNYRKAGANKGYAVVAAMMILLMVTGLGVLSMFSSVSEQYLTTNLAEDQYLFAIAEQSMDRILLHLHYLDGGLFTVASSSTYGLGYDPTPPTAVYTNPNAANTLSPKQILSSASALIMGTSNDYIASNSQYKVDAYIDPLDFEGWWDRGVSRPIAITARVTAYNPGTGGSALFSKVFRIRAKPRSVWDFAYYAMNNEPSARKTARWGESCSGDSTTWWNCQTVLMDGTGIADPVDSTLARDRFEGDVYVSNVAYSGATGYVTDLTNPGRLFMRGLPDFRGQVRWRAPNYYETAKNQTLGGISINSATNKWPDADRSMRPNAKSVLMPPIGILADNSSGGYHNTSPQVYDWILPDPTPSGSSYKWAYRIIFRNDINSDGSSTDPYVVPSSSTDMTGMYRVASAITPSINPGTGPNMNAFANDDPGTMMLYKVPLRYNGTPGSQAIADTEEGYMRAAFYGDTMKKRHLAMMNQGAQMWYSSNASFSFTPNRRCSKTFEPDDAYAIPRGDIDNTLSTTNGLPGTGTYEFIYVPSRGMAVSGMTGASCTGSGTYSGIIYVEGDVIVSGILDGQLTIVASGNIYIDHEIEYENNPTRVHAGALLDPKQADILGLYAGGNIIIPNSYPEMRTGMNAAIMRNHPWRDDWSDPTYNPSATGATAFPPTGRTDYVPVYDDIGDEDIHAVMMSYGQTCTASGGSISCSVVTTSEIQNFQTGLYVMPRTYNTYRTRSATNDSAYTSGGSFDNALNGGNSSGRLTIVGAVIQNIPGRLAYDYQFGSGVSGCSQGTGAACNRIGFSGVNYVRDPRLDYMLPPMPRLITTYGRVPYGYAAWDILSWEELSNSTDISASVW